MANDDGALFKNNENDSLCSISFYLLIQPAIKGLLLKDTDFPTVTRRYIRGASLLDVRELVKTAVLT